MKNLIMSILCFCIVDSGFGQVKTINYQDGDQLLKGLLNNDAGDGAPGVLILPAWMGIDDEAIQAAEQLSKEGYITFVADIYGEGNKPTNASEAGQQAGKYKNDYEAYQRRIRLALEQLVRGGASPRRLAVMGYCFGGTGALEAARAGFEVQGVISIHGGLGKGTRPNGPLKTKILVLHGAADPHVSADEVANFRSEVENAHADWQMIYYADAKHAFTNPASPDFQPLAAQRSWKHLIIFLQELFK
ncbi:dienelactone hydrolase family protein [Sphingobacterium sp. SRCM116780]|uniref:dienelactone hydrolase family protein n=1 Tax=Sphingobacterium sp. SRCM116780 TaxID=2907623 RepID=UPI001F3375D4|nr:dienelactone hydrolase family protein [Sphingobacterium sp. SRCM116780]UIR55931.1 dienelactone hydrolase family protein [Sphingobacterium sp. SRCM116780]